MITCTQATNSAARRMYCAAAPAITTTRYSAACTTFCDRTTPMAASTIATARIQKTTFCATISMASLSAAANTRARRGTSGAVRATEAGAAVRSALLLGLDVGAELEGLGLGHGGHPLAELLLVVEQLGDAGLGVLVLGAPEQRVERAHLDAYPAVHAEPVVDVEPVEDVDAARAAAFAARRRELLVTLDVDAPVGAAATAEHARSAVLLLERDDAARAGRRVLPLVGVLHRDRALHHRAEGHAEPGDDAGQLRLLERHQTATLMIAVAMMFSRPIGMRNFHASDCSWSSRRRG